MSEYPGGINGLQTPVSALDHVTLAHEVAAAATSAGADTTAVVESVLGALRDVGALREEIVPTSSISDGHHTFAELYQFRALLHAHAVRDWLARGYPVTRSWRHHDGQECFGGGWFVIVAQLPTGQVSNHYPAKDWDLFTTTPEVDLAPVWDGHDAPEVIRRLQAALVSEDEPSQTKSSDAVRYALGVLRAQDMGQAAEEVAQELVDRWHRGEGQGQQLHEFLGMSWEEYGAWASPAQG